MAEKIAVVTDKFKIKGEEWRRDMGKAKECLSETGDLLNKLDMYFAGNPVETIKEKALKVQEEEAAAFARVRAHIEKLGEIAAVYEQAERGNLNGIQGN